MNRPESGYSAEADSAGGRLSRQLLGRLKLLGPARRVARALRAARMLSERAKKVARRARRRGVKRARRYVRARRKDLRRRHVEPLRRDWRALTTPGMYRGGRRKAIYGGQLHADLRALGFWRGERPRVALRNYVAHPMWSTYRTHPPLRYAPSPVAELDHWVDLLPETGPDGSVPWDHRSVRRARRPHVLEVEHWSLLAGARLWQWERAVTERRRAVERVRAEECRVALAYSPGSLDHFRRFMAPEVWPKLDYVLPACAPQPGLDGARDGAFTILTIGNRFSDKGIPEALRAFEILRARHGPEVRMALVCNTVPRGWRLPQGVTLYDMPRMTPDVKDGVYRSADVLVELAYVDSLTCPVEASAFGLPTVATRIHHGETFVREGQSGYLVDPPVFAYSDEYGTRWRNWVDFATKLEVMREGGGLDGLVEDVVDRLDAILSGDVELYELRDGARRLHAERFSLEARNAKLKSVYARALAG